MNSLRFEKQQLKQLALLLKCKPKEIHKITGNLKRYYGHRFELKKNKETDGFKTYSDGTIKKRTINQAFGRLEEIQRSIKNQIFRKIEFPDHINGGVRKRSNIANGKSHQGNKYIFTTDLSNCFPNIRPKLAYRAFLDLGYSNVQARWLTKLTTYNHCLPQGTHTSPYLANLCLLPLDKELINLTKTFGITYTRYIDDLTFSSPVDFSHLINGILMIIFKNDFKISWRKTVYAGNQNITGIEIHNNYIDAPYSIKYKAKLELRTNRSYRPISDYVERIRKTNKGLEFINKNPQS